ncbi:hypothetical protein D9619_007513 [Psilocybe cf. subviscida]|uniref:Uncharacterized protein n=1 Tax=Psilocybe cf. subviscida TaxID=2480587 RepID=A0A8H5EWG4_9AGAR|nr:hypothetical protein D9619_007513 [Psilocybe cf. subviscida]
MLSRLEQAIADVLTAGQTPGFDNVFAAYKLHCDKKRLQHAQLYFQIAMDKYPDATEKTQSPYAPLITNIRKEYLESSIDAAVSVFGVGALLPCPCNCGALLDMLQFREQLDIIFGPSAGHFAFPKVRSAKKTNKRRRTPRKVKGDEKKDNQLPEPAFDPFGPSTSRTSM